MILTKAILNEAEKWLDCRETTKNRSLCVDKVHELFKEGSTGSRDAWCAKFVWSITDVACKTLGVPNPLPKSASTANMLSASKPKLRTDNKPAKGAVFYTSRDGGGHVGFVESVSGNKFNTIEGNTNVGKGSADGVYRKQHDTTTKSYQFIHLEDLDTVENNINSLLAPLDIQLGDKTFWTILSIVGIGGLGYFVNNKIYCKFEVPKIQESKRKLLLAMIVASYL